MWATLHETADLVTFPEGILNGNLHFLCSECFKLAIFHSAFLSWMKYEKMLIIEFQKMRDKVIVFGLRSVTVLKRNLFHGYFLGIFVKYWEKSQLTISVNIYFWK